MKAFARASGVIVGLGLLGGCGGIQSSNLVADSGSLASFDASVDPRPVEDTNPHIALTTDPNGVTEVPAPTEVTDGDYKTLLGAQKTSDWLTVRGNHIYHASGSIFMARGANIFDTRGCNGCAYAPSNVAEVKRRIDTLVDDWKGNFIRFNLQSYSSQDYRTQWQGVLDDPSYLADIVDIMTYVRTQKPGTYVLLTLLNDPSFDDHNIPNADTAKIWAKLAASFATFPNIMYGIANEPHARSTDTQEIINKQGAKVHAAMTLSVEAIRAVEDRLKAPHHLIAVQGTTGWARSVKYYLTNPIRGDNIVYEIHPYSPYTQFNDQITTPAKTLPLIIGEFGFVTEFTGSMQMKDTMTMMDLADKLNIPYTGWSFHASCGIALVKKTAADNCGVNSALVPTPWGSMLRAHLAAMDGTPANTVAPTKGLLVPIYNTNVCVTDTASANQTVNALLKPCAPRRVGNTWRLNAENILQLEGKNRCLQEIGNKVQIVTCSKIQRQRFKRNSGRFSTGSRCLQVPTDSPRDNQPLRMGACSNDGKNFFQML